MALCRFGASVGTATGTSLVQKRMKKLITRSATLMLSEYPTIYYVFVWDKIEMILNRAKGA